MSALTQLRTHAAAAAARGRQSKRPVHALPEFRRVLNLTASAPDDGLSPSTHSPRPCTMPQLVGTIDVPGLRRKPRADVRLGQWLIIGEDDNGGAVLLDCQSGCAGARLQRL